MRILVVDDYVDALSALSMLVASMGHQVRACSESAQCIAGAREFQPHLVLLDIGMTGLSGFDLIPQFRQLPFQSELAVLTGYVNEECRSRCEALGVNTFLAKPISKDALASLFADVECGSTASERSS